MIIFSCYYEHPFCFSMKKTVLILFILTIQSTLFAQTHKDETFTHSNYTQFKKLTYWYSDTTMMPHYKGQLFLNRNFRDGKVILNNGQTENYKMRFNIYNNDVEFLNKNREIRSLYKNANIEMVIIDEDSLILDFAYLNKKFSLHFFLLSSNGKTKVLEMPKVNAFIEKNRTPSEKDNLNFVKKPSSLFILKEKREARQVKKQKDLLKIFPNRKNEISQYIKQHALNVTEKDDLIKLVRYYDSL